MVDSNQTQRIALVAAIVLGAALSAVTASLVRVGYDTAYALAWGRDLAAGASLDFTHPSSPTPHPLTIAVSWPLGYLPSATSDAAASGLAGICGVALVVALAVLARDLTRRWLPPTLTVGCTLAGAPVALLALSAGFDVPYAALGVVAVTLTVRHRYTAAAALLSVAALLRPEAVALAGLVYVLARRSGGNTRKVLWVWLAGTATAAAAWLLTGWAGGDPLIGLHSAAGNADLNDDPRGITVALLHVVPDLAAATGALVLIAAGLATISALRSHRHAHESGRLVVGAFVLVGVVLYLAQGMLGTPLVARYLLLPALLCIPLATVAMVDLSDRIPAPRVRPLLAAALSVVLLASVAASNVVAWRDVLSARATQATAFAQADDLLEDMLVRDCQAPFVVRSPAIVPVIALSLDRRLNQIVVSDTVGTGVLLQPLVLDAAALAGYGPMHSLDRQARFPTDAPPRTSNDSWALYSRCTP